MTCKDGGYKGHRQEMGLKLASEPVLGEPTEEVTGERNNQRATTKRCRCGTNSGAKQKN